MSALKTKTEKLSQHSESVLARHAQASAWAGLVGFAQEEGTRLVRGPADTAKHLGADLCFRVEIVIYRVEIEI